MLLLALALSFAAYGVLGDASTITPTSSQHQVVAGSQTYSADRVTHTMSADARLLQINILQPANLCRRQCANGTAGDNCSCTWSRTGTLTWEGITVTALPTSGQVTTITGHDGSTSVHTFTRTWAHSAPISKTSVTSSIETVTDNGTVITRTWTIPAINISSVTSTVVTSTAPNGSTITKTFTLTPHSRTATQPVSISTITENGKTITWTHTFFNTTAPETDTLTTTDNSGNVTTITKTWTIGGKDRSASVSSTTSVITTTDSSGHATTITKTFTIPASITRTHSEQPSSSKVTTSTEITTDASGHATTITKTFTIPASVTRTGTTRSTTNPNENQQLLGASETD